MASREQSRERFQSGHEGGVQYDRSSVPEITDAQRRLFRVATKKVVSPDAIIVDYGLDAEKSGGRTGYDGFIVVDDSVDGNTHISIGMNAQGGIDGKTDFFRISWCNKTTGQVGGVRYLDASGACDPSRVIRSDSDYMDHEYVQYWKKMGGIDYQIYGYRSPTTEEQLDAIAAKIKTGHTNVDMTNKAMEHLKTKWKAERVVGAGMALALRLDNLSRQGNF
jgi:hypothetical protein